MPRCGTALAEWSHAWWLALTATAPDAVVQDIVEIIVYCATVRHVTTVGSALERAGLAAARYHGGLSARVRPAEQERFMQGEADVMVATNAFGMGIDKADIRLVVHYDLPGSLDAYYQEAGRAGRDGNQARAILLFQRADRRLQNGALPLAPAARRAG